MIAVKLITFSRKKQKNNSQLSYCTSNRSTFKCILRKLKISACPRIPLLPCVISSHATSVKSPPTEMLAWLSTLRLELSITAFISALVNCTGYEWSVPECEVFTESHTVSQQKHLYT